MNVSCPACRSVFRVDPAKVPATGVHARCSICGSVIEVGAPQTAAVTSAAVYASTPIAVASSPVPVSASDSATFDAPPADSRAPDRDVEPVGALPEFERPASPAATPMVRDADASAPTPPSDAGEVRARPMNPYLSNTPELRARRLARALVSDLVAYNPQKREEGLRDGTLRQLFRDEIRKSWDEYVEQVGASVAESTPHFQDALNDVLAGGRRVF